MRSSFSDEGSYRAFCKLLGARKEARNGACLIQLESPEGDFVGYSLLAGQLLDGRVDKAPFSDLSQLSDEIEQIVARATVGKESRAYEFISVRLMSYHFALVDVRSRRSAESFIRSLYLRFWIALLRYLPLRSKCLNQRCSSYYQYSRSLVVSLGRY